jgi:putative membrane protein
MVRLLATAIVSLLADAVGLLVAAQVLDDMALDVDGFVTAVVLFALVGLLIEPLLRQVAVRNAPALLGSTALVATLVSLIVTALVSDGLRISGTLTWVLATVIVWAVALVASLLLPLVIFRSVLREARAGRGRSAPAAG